MANCLPEHISGRRCLFYASGIRFISVRSAALSLPSPSKTPVAAETANTVYSNKERGLGRPDIDLRDKKNRRCIIIEAKRSVSEAQMQSDCDAAIRQIRDNQYARQLTGYRQIMRYGVAFYQKQALIKLDTAAL